MAFKDELNKIMIENNSEHVLEDLAKKVCKAVKDAIKQSVALGNAAVPFQKIFLLDVATISAVADADNPWLQQTVKNISKNWRGRITSISISLCGKPELIKFQREIERLLTSEDGFTMEWKLFKLLDYDKSPGRIGDVSFWQYNKEYIAIANGVNVARPFTITMKPTVFAGCPTWCGMLHQDDCDIEIPNLLHCALMVTFTM